MSVIRLGRCVNFKWKKKKDEKEEVEEVEEEEEEKNSPRRSFELGFGNLRPQQNSTPFKSKRNSIWLETRLDFFSGHCRPAASLQKKWSKWHLICLFTHFIIFTPAATTETSRGINFETNRLSVKFKSRPARLFWFELKRLGRAHNELIAVVVVVVVISIHARLERVSRGNGDQSLRCFDSRLSRFCLLFGSQSRLVPFRRLHELYASVGRRRRGWRGRGGWEGKREREGGGRGWRELDSVDRPP